MPSAWLFHHNPGAWPKSRTTGVYDLNITGGPSPKNTAQDDKLSASRIGTRPNCSTWNNLIGDHSGFVVAEGLLSVERPDLVIERSIVAQESSLSDDDNDVADRLNRRKTFTSPC
jgi:hypothetical protein